MPLADAYGLPVTAASRAAVDAYDRGVRALLGFGADTTPAFQSAVEHDPEFALARAALAVSLYLDEKIPEGRAAMDAAAQAAPGLPERERRHIEALALWVGGRGNEAIDVIKSILAEHPRDVVLLQRLYFIYFWQGRSGDMLDLTDSVAGAFDDDSYVLGLHAFSLEENRRFDEALGARRARDGAQSAGRVGRPRDGARALRARRQRARRRGAAAAHPPVRPPRATSGTICSGISR